MWKFLLVSLVIWFFVKRLFKFNVVVYKGGFNSPSDAYQTRKPEGAITIENTPKQSNTATRADNGDYVEYEEVK